MKILLAIDGSPYTKKMLAYLTTHLDMFSSEDHSFTLLSVYMPLPNRVYSSLPRDVVTSYFEEEFEKVSAPVITYLARHNIVPEAVWKMGNPGDVIAEFAEAGQFDLLVMGSRGHGALGNLVLGSVATRVLAHCSTPVLIVR